jgi:hypothetical protein
MLSLLVSILTILAPKLPIMNNIYKTSINFSVLGNQNIEYQRIERYKSIIKLHGLINVDGFIYFNKDDVYKYNFDENINNIISKYKCKISDAYYNNLEDKIYLKLKIKILNLKKTIILENESFNKKIDL